MCTSWQSMHRSTALCWSDDRTRSLIRPQRIASLMWLSQQAGSYWRDWLRSIWRSTQVLPRHWSWPHLSKGQGCWTRVRGCRRHARKSKRHRKRGLRGVARSCWKTWKSKRSRDLSFCAPYLFELRPIHQRGGRRGSKHFRRCYRTRFFLAVYWC